MTLSILATVLTILLAIATVLGGIAAIPYLKDVVQRTRSVRRRLDSSCVYVLRTRKEIEARAKIHTAMVLGPFAPPPDVPGRYGPLTNPEARRAFTRLQELGLIEPASFNNDRAVTEYRWTRLGRRIAAPL